MYDSLYALVRTPDGTRVACTIIDSVPCPLSLLQQLYVRAVEGKPFDGRRRRVVHQAEVTFVSRKDYKQS